MKLEQKRIRGTKKLLSDIDYGEEFLLGVEVNDQIIEKIESTKLCINITPGTLIFPSPEIGIFSKRNAVGEYIPQKNLPKEVAHKALEWELTDWGGYLHTGTTYVPYYRYPRKFIEPKELKLKITDVQGRILIIVNEVFVHCQDYENRVVFAANLMLEIFGVVDTYRIDKDTGVVVSNEVKSVDWEILPPGEKIWDSITQSTSSKVSKSEQKLMLERLQFLRSYIPSAVYNGIGGYSGYLVFEFEKKGLCIFDSIMYGNAAYVFKGEWEDVSRLTKKEIIQENLALDRIVHHRNWESRMKEYLD
jgi:hypothetical protein